MHLAWDVMVGLGTLLIAARRSGTARSGCSSGGSPRASGSCRVAALAGSLSVLAMEAGWVVTEVGRQPWIVFDYFKVTQAATTNDGVWVTFLVIAALYIGVAVTLVLILRTMSRRFRERGR